jgi:hypothetical protein
MSAYFVTAGEPRRTFQPRTFAAAVAFAFQCAMDGRDPVRLLEEIDWQRCLLPSEREALARIGEAA